MKYYMISIVLICLGFSPLVSPGLGAAEETTKRLGFELSLGLSLVNPQEFYLRQSGVSTLVSQYAALNQAAVTETGEFVENKVILPFQGQVRYGLSDKWSLKGGLEYGASGATSQKVYQIALSGGAENQSFDFEYRVSFLAPFVGAAYHISDQLEINAAVGLAFTQVSYSEDFLSEMTGLPSGTSLWNYEAKGTAPRLSLGALYRLALNQKGLALFAKVEYVLLTVASLTGTKQVAFGTVDEPEIEGTLYHHAWNPYGRGSFETWELYEDEPPVQALNAEKLRLNLSGLRLMLGISF